MARLIYMDHAATTPVHPEVRREMSPYFTEYFGNPETLYSLGRQCDQAVTDARRKVADLVGATPEEIYFTSGGTESDNWAIKGVTCSPANAGKHIITSAIEHHAVLETCQFLRDSGWKVTYVPVDAYGLVSPEDVRKAITGDTILISVMHANNEVGTIEPVAEITEIAREHGIPFHTDAVQTVGKIDVNVKDIRCDLLSLAAHKFYGPKGVGALYIRKGTKIRSFMHGGGQEEGLRGGTHNVAGIVGLGKAAELAMAGMKEEAERVAALRDRLSDEIAKRIPNVKFNGHPERRLPGHVNLCVEGVEAESILLHLNAKRICASSGSACTTGTLEPSHVLRAMGIPLLLAHGSLRFTLGAENSEEEIPYVVGILAEIVERLRKMSPTYTPKDRP